MIYVNDGSQDDTLAQQTKLHDADPRVVVVNLSRNFGKEIATTAGLDHARGEAVVVIDADLQDPPEVIPDLVATWREGLRHGVCATAHAGRGQLAQAGDGRAVYRLMHNFGRVQMPPDTGDFRLMSRRVVDALLRLREQHRFMKGLFAWVGFPSRAVLYDRAPRLAGRSSWSYWRLWNLALEGITSFTLMPLKIATYLGLVVSLLAGTYCVVIVVKTLIFGNPVPGYPSLMAVLLFMGGAQLIVLGIIGEYLGRIFNETKQRPLYFVERVLSRRAMAEVEAGAVGTSRQN